MFELFLQGIAYLLLMNENFYGILLESKVLPESWPDGPARSTATRYMEIRGRDGHGAAAATLYEAALTLREHAEVPFDADALRVVFQRKRHAHLVDRLVSDLKTQPDRASEHIRRFEESLKSGSELVHLGSDIDRAYSDLKKRSSEGVAMRPLKGFPLLTMLVNGFNPERFALFIAKSGFGKTTAMVNIALAASETMSVLFVNMEMSRQDFVERAVCAAGEIDYTDFVTTPDAYQKSVEKIQEQLILRDFHFSTGRSMTLSEIKAECTMRKKRTGLDFVVIDYDQKIDLVGSDEEWRAIQNATKFFEELAKELQCYIVLLAQEGDGGDISSSKRAKFVATTVFRFYRDEEDDLNGRPVYLIEAMKNRYGRSGGKLRMDYNPACLSLKEKGFYEKQNFEERSVSTILATKKSRLSNRTPAYVPGAD